MNTRFVLLPCNISLIKDGLHYLDLLIYVAIRSFQNGGTGLCKPSFETIAARAGVSKKLVSMSIKRLERSGHLIVKRSPKKKVANLYAFKETDAFAQIPYDIFDSHDLTSYEKAMLLAIRQCFNNHSLVLYGNLSFIEDMTGLKYKVIYTQFRKLVDKQYILEVKKGRDSGRVAKEFHLAEKINWKYYRKPIAINKPDSGDSMLSTIIIG
ncbi:hypothetical protein FHW88_002794 [Mucilaginibacter sp. SG538B]|uniref:helix-turn-helix domain-containing protein n=1 Tax=Mucilaginibacter sp. SG538B TaxID=2587021 RepID=UPI00159D5AD8|nr:helix-turn-helix domain-containing protein [Mucilaginibacter sp. SG538B]NVM64505.1 hypothetical protein [Mucilaginibacter sp. SG538B]